MCQKDKKYAPNLERIKKQLDYRHWMKLKNDEQKKSLTGKIRPISLGLILAVAAPIAANIGYNGNRTYVRPYEIEFRKMDGPYSYTIVTIHQTSSYLTMERFDLLDGIREYKDNGLDGVNSVKLDLPLFSINGYEGEFNKHDHYRFYPDVFDEAEKDYRQQLGLLEIDLEKY